MKVLYAIQGTGNGHVCRAQEIVPLISGRADVDVLVSGIQSDIQLPFPVKYVCNGLSFIFGKKGGIDFLETYKKTRLKALLKEIKELPVEEYDLVISDFEPVSSWACYFKNKPCISLSHQSAVLNKKSPQPKKTDPAGRAILKAYAPSSVQYGFHFKSYDERIYTPVIRRQIREAAVSDEGHYTVYLPAYSDKRIVRMLGEFEGIRWHVFSKHFQHKLDTPDISVYPISNDEFIKSMESAHGVLCGAGFETPAEALYLQKKLLVIPMKNQFEQHCNAAALKELGVPVMKGLKKKYLPVLQDWLQNEEKPTVDFPDCTEEIIIRILNTHIEPESLIPDTATLPVPGNEDDLYSVKRLRTLTLKRILSKLTK